MGSADLVDKNGQYMAQPHDYDVVFIGGGISTATTLTGLIACIGSAQRPPGLQLRVAVVDDHGELGGGLAYGSRGGASSLIITSLEDFCPEPTRTRFVAWLEQNSDTAFKSFHDYSGELSKEWASRSEEALRAGKYDELYLPRAVFGAFIKSMLMAEVSDADWLTLEHIDGEVVEVSEGSQMAVKVAESHTSTTRHLSTRNVVLGIGTPPPRLLFSDTSPGDCRFIDNVYEPSIVSQLDRLRQALVRTEASKLVLVGSNATALDILFNVIDDIELNAMVEHITVLSPQGRFPHRLSKNSVDFSACSLEALITQDTPILASEIGLAVRADQSRAEEAGYNIAEILPAVNSRVMEALQKCDPEQTRIFAETIGVEIGRVQRRAGGLYCDMAERLEQSGRLTHVRGKYESAEETDSGMLRILGKNDSGHLVELESDVGAIVNCTGFEQLGAPTGSSLVRSLIDNRIVTVNGSQRGFTVADDFSASPGVYVNGPCLAGNVVQGKPIWHMEHCGRILDVASQLSPILSAKVLDGAG